MSSKYIGSFSGDLEFLSNMYKIPIYFNESKYDNFQPDFKVYPSSENLYQALKCKYIKDRELFQNVNPHQSKKIGRTIQIRPDWEFKNHEYPFEIISDVRLEAMKLVIDLKFKNIELAEKLIALSDDKLIEFNNWGDRFFGICDGEGLDHLGKILRSKKQQIIKDKERIL